MLFDTQQLIGTADREAMPRVALCRVGIFEIATYRTDVSCAQVQFCWSRPACKSPGTSTYK